MKNLKEKFRNGIYGVAVGDALGLPVQFCEREEVRRYPVTGMLDDGGKDVFEKSISDMISML